MDLPKSSNHINFGQSSAIDTQINQTQPPLKPNFTKQELNNVELPSWIAKEIRAEKYRIFFLTLFSGILFAISLFFILAYFIPNSIVNLDGEQTKWNIPVDWIPHPAFMIITALFFLFILVLISINYFHLITAVKSYKGDLLMHQQTLPQFIKKEYRALITRIVYLNWLGGTIYLVSGIIIGVFFILKTTMHKPYHTELIIMYVILGTTAFIHLYSLISIKYRKGNLSANYNGDIVPTEEAHQLAKSANKKCLIVFLVFLVIVFIFIFIPYAIIRKRENRSINPIK